MKKIRAAVVGYGNIGQYALQALETAPDFEVAGIVRRNGAENKPAELAQYEVVKDTSPPLPALARNMPTRFCPSASTPSILLTSIPTSAAIASV